MYIFFFVLLSLFISILQQQASKIPLLLFCLAKFEFNLCVVKNYSLYPQITTKFI